MWSMCFSISGYLSACTDPWADGSCSDISRWSEIILYREDCLKTDEVAQYGVFIKRGVILYDIRVLSDWQADLSIFWVKSDSSFFHHFISFAPLGHFIFLYVYFWNCSTEHFVLINRLATCILNLWPSSSRYTSPIIPLPLRFMLVTVSLAMPRGTCSSATGWASMQVAKRPAGPLT